MGVIALVIAISVVQNHHPSRWNSKLIRSSPASLIAKEVTFAPLVPKWVPKGFNLDFAEKVYCRVRVPRQALRLAYSDSSHPPHRIDVVETPCEGFSCYESSVGMIARNGYFEIGYKQSSTFTRKAGLDVIIYSNQAWGPRTDEMLASLAPVNN